MPLRCRRPAIRKRCKRMVFLRPFALASLAAVLLLVPALAAQRNPGRAAARAQPAPRNAPPTARAAQPKADRHPGEQILQRLQSMTPEEREQALARLPPARRAQIEKRIQNFENLPPAAQERRLDRLERLNSLPPQKQNQVRRSIRQLNQMPDDRKKTI